MSAGTRDTERDGVPSDYPGRVVGFPDDVTHIVYALYGVQTRAARAASDFIAKLSAHCRRADGPRHVERGQYRDNEGWPCELLMAYWLDPAAYARWWRDAEIARWWQALPDMADRETGYWREILTPPKERFQYAAGVDDKAGSAATLPLVPCNTFGYWGAYRDRLPASHHDLFRSPLAAVPSPQRKQTRGRRLRVLAPDNLCFIREGQGWGQCEPDEKRIWDEQMAGVVDRWVAFLGTDPVATGCLSIRDCREQDVATGAVHARRSQLAFLLSLGHIEHAARTQPTHLAVRDTFIRLYSEPGFTPRMHVWVEVQILKSDELDTEYVNCHPATGLLPYFEVQDVESVS